jgi:dephospho-CoA kinase
MTSEGHFLVVYDVPLLLEKPQNNQVDYVLVATADEGVQRTRVLNRPGMSEEKFIYPTTNSSKNDKYL